MCGIQTPSTYTQNDRTNTGIHTILHQTEDSWHFILRPPKPSSSNSYVGICWTTPHPIHLSETSTLEWWTCDVSTMPWEGGMLEKGAYGTCAVTTVLPSSRDEVPCLIIPTTMHHIYHNVFYVRPNTINLYSKWPYKYRDPYYIASNWGFMALHPPSSQTVFF